MRIKIPIFCLVPCLVLFFGSAAVADVVKLKNGRTLEGAIISETKDAIVIDIGIGEASISRGDIAVIERSKEDNAAIYYIRAINSATYLDPGEIRKKLEKIRDNNWRSGAKEMEEILNENQKCLGEIEKALSIKRCDFYFEQKYRYLPEKDQSLHPKDVVSLGWILELKGRLLEDRQKFNEAIDTYLSALTFALQISQSDNPAIRRGALAIEVEVYGLIKNYLNSVNVSKANCLKIIDYLDSPGRQNFTLKEFIEGGREWFMSSFQSYEHEIVIWSRGETKLDKKLKRQVVNFARDLLKTATEMTDKYFGAFSKAAASDSAVDWKLAVDEYDNLVKNNKVQSLEDDIDRNKFEHESFINLENAGSKDVKNIVTTVLVFYLSKIKSGVDDYKEAAKNTVELKALAKLKSVTTYK